MSYHIFLTICSIGMLVIAGTLFTYGEDLNTEFPSIIEGGDAKVYNGKPVNPPYSHPYIVQIDDGYTSDKETTGGVIIDEWTILTVGNRAFSFKTIFAGKHFIEGSEESEQKRNVCTYSMAGRLHDFVNNYGLLHLSVPLELNKFVKTAVLPQDGDYTTTNCKVLGWGRITEGQGHDLPKELREAPVTIIDPNKCSTKHPTVLCLSKGPCFYDQGAVVACPNKAGVYVTIGLVGLYNVNCERGLAAATKMLDPRWVTQEIENATAKCRANYCCNNAGKINGDPVTPHSRPYIVQIHYKSSKEVTIGVLINAYTILTSGLKLDNILKVTAGKHFFGKYEGTQQTRRACHISQHPNFDKPQNAYGYGLIHLSDPFVLNEYVNGISIAPKGAFPKESCSIIAWQGNSSETVLREQWVQFKDPKKCKNPHQTITCVNAGACLHDWGSPVICSYDSKIYVQAIVSSAKAYCETEILASIPDLPRDWLATELKKAETTCGKSTL